MPGETFGHDILLKLGIVSSGEATLDTILEKTDKVQAATDRQTAFEIWIRTTGIVEAVKQLRSLGVLVEEDFASTEKLVLAMRKIADELAAIGLTGGLEAVGVQADQLRVKLETASTVAATLNEQLTLFRSI